MPDTQAVATNDAHVDLDASAERTPHDAAGRQLTHPGYILAGGLLATVLGLGHWYLPEAYLVQSLGILGGLLGGVYAGMGIMAREAKKEMLQIGMGLVITVLAFAGVWESRVFRALVLRPWRLGPDKRASQMPQLTALALVCPHVPRLRFPVRRHDPRLVGLVSASRGHATNALVIMESPAPSDGNRVSRFFPLCGK